MTPDVTAVADIEIKNARNGEMATVQSLWQKQTTVIVFFRRWGCMFCRLWAKELSKLAPVLKENDIRLVGVGVEEFGVEDFIQGNFFSGDIFIDPKKAVYGGLKFKRYNWITVLLSLLSAESMATLARGRKEHVEFTTRGDALQNGGALVVKKGGEILFFFHQDKATDNVSNKKFSEILGIKYSVSEMEVEEISSNFCS